MSITSRAAGFVFEYAFGRLASLGDFIMFACNWYIIGAALLLSATSLSIADEPAAEKAKPKTVKVAAIQCSSDLGDIAGNRKKLTALIKEAAGEGAKIVVLPETSITGYSTWDLLSSFGNS